MLSAAMKEYPDHVEFNVGVFFSAMVEDDGPVSGTEYMKYMSKCMSLIRKHYPEMLFGNAHAMGEECHYFHISATREQIESLDKILFTGGVTMYLTAIVCLK